MIKVVRKIIALCAFSISLSGGLFAASAAPTEAPAAARARGQATDKEEVSYTPVYDSYQNHLFQVPGYAEEEIYFCSNRAGDFFYFNRSEYEKSGIDHGWTVVDSRCNMYGVETFEALQEKKVALKRVPDFDSVIVQQIVIYYQQYMSGLFLKSSNGVKNDLKKLKQLAQENIDNFTESCKTFTVSDDKLDERSLRTRRAYCFALKCNKWLLKHLNMLEEKINEALERINPSDSGYKESLKTIYSVLIGDCPPKDLEEIGK